MSELRGSIDLFNGRLAEVTAVCLRGSFHQCVPIVETDRVIYISYVSYVVMFSILQSFEGLPVSSIVPLTVTMWDLSFTGLHLPKCHC